MSKPLYFVHISDTHIGPTRDYQRHGLLSYPCAEKVIELIHQLPQRPDFVIHTGDVVTDPDPDSYQLAAELFKRLEVPIYFTVGNHDRAEDLRHYFEMGPRHDLLADELMYTFEVGGESFLVLDGRAPDDLDPNGLISDQQLAELEKICVPEGPPLTVFIHFPLLPLNSPWFDEKMVVLNGIDVHQILLRAGKRLRGVFHGHVHQSMQTVRDGISYTCAPSTFAQFGAWPSLPEPVYTDEPPGFGFIHLLPEQMIVHQHQFER